MDTPPSLTTARATDDNVDAPKPFDSSAKADVILRSRDCKLFYVLKILLRLASPVFDIMFSSLEGQRDKKSDVEMPIIPAEEDSTTLLNLLLLIYPYSQKPSSTIDACFEMAKAARKYSMDDIDKRIRELVMMSDILWDEPLRVFAIAIFLGWQDVMKAAVDATLEVPLRNFGWCQELALLSAEDYHKLLQWRFTCYDAVERCLNQEHYKKSTRQLRPEVAILEERLKTTGCPSSGSLINDATKAACLQKSPHQPSSTLYDTLKYLEKKIDEATSKVPLDVGRHRNKMVVGSATAI